MHQYKTQLWLPISTGEAWSFFSSPKNLALITPPDMDFKILSSVGADVYEGMIIDYKVKPLFDTIREASDALEMMVDDKLWPMTKYREMLFTK